MSSASSPRLGAVERPCQRRLGGVVRPQGVISLGPEHRGGAVALDVGAVLHKMVVVLHLAEPYRLEVPGPGPFVPGPRRDGIAGAQAEVAGGVRQLGPRVRAATPSQSAIASSMRPWAARSSARCLSTSQ